MYVCEDTEEDIHTETFTQRQTQRDIYHQRILYKHKQILQYINIYYTNNNKKKQ